MSEMTSIERGEEFLMHFGVKGMRWGVRKQDEGPTGDLILSKECKNGTQLSIYKQPPPKWVLKEIEKDPSYKEQADLQHTFELRDKSGSKVGSAAFYQASPTKLDLEWIGVQKAHRSNGYARAALEGVMDYSRANGITDLEMSATKLGQPLYESLGFQRTPGTGGFLSLPTYTLHIPAEVRQSDASAKSLADYIIGRIDASAKLNDLNHSGKEETMTVMTAAQRGEAFLAHYGKKGMKWGVRNDNGHVGERVKLKKLDKMDKQWEAANNGVAGRMAAYNHAAEKMNKTELNRINNKPEHVKARDAGKFKDWNNPSPELDAYNKDMEDTFNGLYAQAMTQLGKNPSGTKQFVIKTDDDGQPYAELDVIKHAAGDVEPRYKLNLDAKGMVTSFTMEEAELKHYGVKGMRWGVTTKSGGSGGGGKPPVEATIKSAKPGTYVKATGGARQPPHEDAVKAVLARQKARASTTDSLSNDELQKVVTRMNLERQYADLSFQSDRRSKGQRFIAGLTGRKRYNGEKRKYEDPDEANGERLRKAADMIAEERRKSRATV